MQRAGREAPSRIYPSGATPPQIGWIRILTSILTTSDKDEPANELRHGIFSLSMHARGDAVKERRGVEG